MYTDIRLDIIRLYQAIPREIVLHHIEIYCITRQNIVLCCSNLTANKHISFYIILYSGTLSRLVRSQNIISSYLMLCTISNYLRILLR